MPAAERARVVRLRQRGLKIEAIADRVGYGKSLVSRVLVAAGMRSKCAVCGRKLEQGDCGFCVAEVEKL